MGAAVLANRLVGAEAFDDAGPVAALSMYDLPELSEANDQLWAAIAERLRAAGVAGVPARLTRSLAPETVWSAPGLPLAHEQVAADFGYPDLV